MNEPKQYEVQYLEQGAWQVLRMLIDQSPCVVDDPIKFINETAYTCPFRFKQLPDGSLWRVEAERELGPEHFTVQKGDERMTAADWNPVPRTMIGIQFPTGSPLKYRYRRPAHLVLIPTEPEAQPSPAMSMDTTGADYVSVGPSPSKAVKFTCETTPITPTPEPQRETEWRDIETKDAQIGDEHSYAGARWVVITTENTVRRFHAGELVGYRLRRPIAPPQREGTDGTRTDTWAYREGCKIASNLWNLNKLAYEDINPLGRMIETIFVALELRALMAEDAAAKGEAARLQAGGMEQQIAALQAERDAFRTQAASDAKLALDTGGEFAALIRERDGAVAERDAVAGQLAQAIADRDSARESNARLGGLNAAAGRKNDTLCASLTAAKAELATCREALERFEPIRHMLPGSPPIPFLFGSTTDYPSFTNGESLSTPPPSAQA